MYMCAVNRHHAAAYDINVLIFYLFPYVPRHRFSFPLIQFQIILLAFLLTVFLRLFHIPLMYLLGLL